MYLLLDNEFAPMTSELGFLQTDIAVAVQAFEDWQTPLLHKRGGSLARRTVAGTLQSVLATLLPLTDIGSRRSLFIPTAGPWIAFLDNGWRGAEVFGRVSYLAQAIGCRGVRVVAIPDTAIDKSLAPSQRRDGAIIFEVYSSHDTHWLNVERSVMAMRDGDRWKFHHSGTAFRFEDQEQYTARRVQERFTIEMLQKYAAELELYPFDEHFYLPTTRDTAVLFAEVGIVTPNARYYSQREASGAV